VSGRTPQMLGVLPPPFLRAGPKGKLAAFMHTELVTVNEKDNQRDVAKKMAKYNLLALPVVGDEETLKGVVTVDDALDVVLPSGWKKRLHESA